MMLMFSWAWIDYNDFILDGELSRHVAQQGLKTLEPKDQPFSLNRTKNDMLNRKTGQMFYLFDQHVFDLYIQQYAT